MGFFNIVRAIVVRLCFACHGLLAILLLTISSRDRKYWLLATALGGLLVESIVTLLKKRGREWKWFCPSVFFYLLSTVPAIWFLELHALEKRIQISRGTRVNITTNYVVNHTAEPTHSVLGLGVDGLQFPTLEYNRWIQIIEQFLLLLLILGRWMLPKGKLTHDQLSQLLLVYIGTAADIVEFFEAFKEDEVKENRLLCRIILSIWSWSLLQFTMVLTATRARKDQSGILSSKSRRRRRRACCTPDVYGIVISILMQDLPFLILRLVLIFHFSVTSYSNLFFTAKNSLVILLLMYRLIVVQIALYQRNKPTLLPDKKPSSQALLNGYSELWKLDLPGQCTCQNGTDTISKRNAEERELDYFNFYDDKTEVNLSNGRSVWDPVAERAPLNPIPKHDPCTSFTLMLQASKIMNDYNKKRKQQGDVIIVKNHEERRRQETFDDDDDDMGPSLHLMI